MQMLVFLLLLSETATLQSYPQLLFLRKESCITLPTWWYPLVTIRTLWSRLGQVPIEEIRSDIGCNVTVQWRASSTPNLCCLFLFQNVSIFEYTQIWMMLSCIFVNDILLKPNRNGISLEKKIWLPIHTVTLTNCTDSIVATVTFWSTAQNLTSLWWTSLCYFEETLISAATLP